MTDSFLDSKALEKQWVSDSRWKGVTRPYSADDVISLRNSIEIEYTLAKEGSAKLWGLLNEKKSWISALGAVTGNQGVQMVKAGLKAIYLSGWQVAADANTQNTTYPDHSLYPSNSGPLLANKINNALLRAEQVERVGGNQSTDYLVPIIADGESGFGGALNIFELTKNYIESGVSESTMKINNQQKKNVGIWEEKLLFQPNNT